MAGLTIEPGVRVEFLGNYLFEVAGVLTAIGAEEDPIVFTTAAANTEGWQGILFKETDHLSKLIHCSVEGAVNSGIQIDESLPPTIEHCTFSNNHGPQGGGINIFLSRTSASELTLKDCVFRGNTSSGHGGALLVNMNEGDKINIVDCLFEDNTANPSYANGNFVGGALHLVQGDALISNSFFKGNRSNARCSATFSCNVTARGGAIYLGVSTSNTTIENSYFFENQTDALNAGDWFFGGTSNSYGAGLYVNAGTATVTNSIFAHNTTTRSNRGPSDAGGGLYVNGGSVTVVNSTFADNLDATGVHLAGGTLDIMNSIIFFNNGEGVQVSGSPTITYSDVQGCYEGEENICSNPIFNFDCYQIQSLFSPCIDAGNSESQYDDVCLPPSLGGVRNDMGAHGGPGACEWVYCNGDFNKDCDIDGSDLSVFAADFGRTDCSSDCEGDFDSDNDVDGSDLAVFATNFGRTDCCPN